MLLWLAWKLYFWRINRAIRQGDNSGALKLARQYARLDSDVEDARWWATWTKLAVEREFASWPRDPITGDWVVPAGAFQDHEALLRYLLRKNPDSFALGLELADVLIKRATHERLVDQAEEASSLLEQLRVKRPKSPDVLYRLADIAFHRKDWDEVWRLIDAAQPELSYEKDPVLFQSVITLLAFVPGEGRQRAKEMLIDALEIDPTRANYVSLLGSLTEEDDPAEAAKLFEKARSLEPDRSWDEDLEHERKLLKRWGPDWWTD